jgi:hypothetical protein
MKCVSCQKLVTYGVFNQDVSLAERTLEMMCWPCHLSLRSGEE